LLDRVSFPPIRTFDSSRTPKRGERLATPRTLAEVDLTAIIAALAAVETENPVKPRENPHRQAQLEQELAAAKAQIGYLEQQNRELTARLERIAALAAGSASMPNDAVLLKEPEAKIAAQPVRPLRVVTSGPVSGDGAHPAARKLLIAAAQHAPARFTWGQLATLAGLKPSGGHFNAGRKDLRTAGYVDEGNGLVTATAAGLKAAGEVPPTPSTPAERLALWCDRLPSPAPEMLRTLADKARPTWKPMILRQCSAKSRPAAIGIPGSLSCVTMG
jgi:hypothetical protein